MYSSLYLFRNFNFVDESLRHFIGGVSFHLCLGGEHQAVLENGWSNLLDIFGRYEIAPLQQGVCLASLEHCHRSSGRCSQINGTGAAGLLNYLGYIAKQALVDNHLIYIAAQLQEFCLAQNGLNIGSGEIVRG